MRILTFSLLFLIVFSSCRFMGGERISGNGKISTRDQTVGSFENIEAGGNVMVYVQQNPTQSVKVETDDNLFEYLEIRTDGNTLKIRPKNGYNLDPSKEIIVYASAPKLKELTVSGASKLRSQGTLTGDNVSLNASGASDIQMDVNLSKIESDLSGASSIQLKGTAKTFSAEASGASKILCFDLATDKAKVNVSGASKANVSAEKELDIEASGASDVEYRGNANINQKSSGASSVKKM